MPNVEAGRAALLARKPFIVAPRGMLSSAALAFSHLKKRAVWALMQGNVVRRASCIHATSEQEHDEIRDFGSKPYRHYSEWNRHSRIGRSFAQRDRTGRVVLSLGRIYPKKGLDRLVRAWAQVEFCIPNGGCVSLVPTNSATPGNLPRWPRD